MRWSRITLEATDARSRRAPNHSPRYFFELPLISDGRIAMHELAANTQRAVVEREMRRGGVVSGSLVLRDKQCIWTWPDNAAYTLPPVRLFGATFGVGATVALRPGFGPIEFYEVLESTPVTRAVAALTTHKA